MKTQLFRNWQVKQNIVTPIITNLLTAFLLFLSVVIFKGPIYQALGLTVNEYPIYCLVEPYNYIDDSISSDLFIINLENIELTESKLRGVLKDSGSGEIKSYIRIKWDRSTGTITNIQEDELFNKGKGKLSIERDDDNADWIIKIKEIKGKGILKLLISTDYKRPITRSAKASIPFKVIYPGK